jgi:hypothetical protein
VAPAQVQRNLAFGQAGLAGFRLHRQQSEHTEPFMIYDL